MQTITQEQFQRGDYGPDALDRIARGEIEVTTPEAPTPEEYTGPYITEAQLRTGRGFKLEDVASGKIRVLTDSEAAARAEADERATWIHVSPEQTDTKQTAGLTPEQQIIVERLRTEALARGA